MLVKPRSRTDEASVVRMDVLCTRACVCDKKGKHSWLQASFPSSLGAHMHIQPAHTCTCTCTCTCTWQFAQVRLYGGLGNSHRSIFSCMHMHMSHVHVHLHVCAGCMCMYVVCACTLYVTCTCDMCMYVRCMCICYVHVVHVKPYTAALASRQVKAKCASLYPHVLTRVRTFPPSATKIVLSFATACSRAGATSDAAGTCNPTRTECVPCVAA